MEVLARGMHGFLKIKLRSFIKNKPTVSMGPVGTHLEMSAGDGAWQHKWPGLLVRAIAGVIRTFGTKSKRERLSFCDQSLHW